MLLLDTNLEYRIIFGISAMVLLFASFLIVFITSQRKKLQYHKNLQKLYEEQQQNLQQQNLELENRVKERTLEIMQQKEALQKSLQELRSTQLQLVQREKMASLGELTAGIAHEIQNPLNFVNNFSDINMELLDELETELKTGEREEAILIAENIRQNLAKIYQHGRRADSIVKGMLEHSRVNRGQKEPTDINVLAGEMLQLSYHGIKAKDKTFYASIETHFDKNVGKLNIISPDVGRVLLNLFNNAFYAVLEKKKKSTDQYFPVVSVSTARTNDKFVITVNDNGLGIPAEILNKVFQPFFTTKPTGEGTGLGLSLSYDIIKAHRGELKVETKEGACTSFIVELPTGEV